jgi:hypothetical protein
MRATLSASDWNPISLLLLSIGNELLVKELAGGLMSRTANNEIK